MTKKEEKMFRLLGYRVLFGGALIHLVIGTFYLWGAISLYVASWLRSYDDSISIDLVKSIFPFMMLTINVMPSFGIKLAEKIGFKVSLTINIIIYSLAVFLCSFITNFWGFFVVYAFVGGVSNGLIYMVPVVLGLKYFPDKKGMVNGIIIAGYGFGSFIFNFIALAVVNQDNVKPTIEDDEGKHEYFDEDVYGKVPRMLRILALCYVIIGLIGTLLVKVPTQEQIKHHEEFMILTKEHEQKKVVEHHECANMSQGIHSRPFWILMAMGVLGPYFGLLMANNYKVYGIDKGHSDYFVTLVGSFGSAANGCSRFFWAVLFDKYGFKKVYFAIMAIQLILTATLSSISSVGALYLIWHALTMGCEGGQFSTLPAVTTKVFGHKVGPLIYGFILVMFAVSNIASFFITKAQLDNWGWPAMFWISFGLTVLSALMNLFFNEKYEFL